MAHYFYLLCSLPLSLSLSLFCQKHYLFIVAPTIITLCSRCIFLRQLSSPFECFILFIRFFSSLMSHQFLYVVLKSCIMISVRFVVFMSFVRLVFVFVLLLFVCFCCCEKKNAIIILL